MWYDPGTQRPKGKKKKTAENPVFMRVFGGLKFKIL
jgi:hypothetical protein